FFFQAEDGIRDGHVTGVQTCALPIFGRSAWTIAARSAISLRTCTGAMPSSPEVANAASTIAAGLPARVAARRSARAARRTRRSEIGRASCRERVGMAGRGGGGEDGDA